MLVILFKKHENGELLLLNYCFIVASDQCHNFPVFLQLISRKDKATFEKLDYLTSKEENCARMREYIRSLKMVPCIPYLGESSSVCSLCLSKRALLHLPVV